VQNATERNSRAERLFQLNVHPRATDGTMALVDNCAVLWGAEELAVDTCTDDHWVDACMDVLLELERLSTMDESPDVDAGLAAGQASLVELGVCPALDE
jgi:hypothetical protein